MKKVKVTIWARAVDYLTFEEVVEVPDDATEKEIEDMVERMECDLDLCDHFTGGEPFEGTAGWEREGHEVGPAEDDAPASIQAHRGDDGLEYALSD